MRNPSKTLHTLGKKATLNNSSKLIRSGKSDYAEEGKGIGSKTAIVHAAFKKFS